MTRRDWASDARTVGGSEAARVVLTAGLAEARAARRGLARW
jgi:hypothetical protein